jgi:hypothetical protein
MARSQAAACDQLMRPPSTAHQGRNSFCSFAMCCNKQGQAGRFRRLLGFRGTSKLDEGTWKAASLCTGHNACNPCRASQVTPELVIGAGTVLEGITWSAENESVRDAVWSQICVTDLAALREGLADEIGAARPDSGNVNQHLCQFVVFGAHLRPPQRIRVRYSSTAESAKSAASFARSSDEMFLRRPSVATSAARNASRQKARSGCVVLCAVLMGGEFKASFHQKQALFEASLKKEL